MKNISLRYGTVLLAGLFTLANAWGHATVSPKQAVQGSYQRLSFGITHGCEGSSTIEVIVFLPESIMGAKPMPKAGWTIETEVKDLAVPYTSHGKEIKQDVRVIHWKSGSLPDAHYDEFVVMSKLANKAGPIALPVTQLCEKGRLDWHQLPDASAQRMPYPAPVIELVPGEHQH